MTVKAMRQKNYRWSRDELILALDLYHHLAVSDMRPNHPKIIELSELLNRLRSVEPVDEKYRNANGVAMKLHNFARFDSNRNSSLTHGSEIEEQLWNEFRDSRSKSSEAAATIRSRLNS